MARSVAEIKKSMTDAFMADATIRERYGLAVTDTFNDRFSPVSLESILFFIVAACHYVLERLFDRYREDVEDMVANVVVASVPWYYKVALAYQDGDELVFDEKTMAYRYPTISEAKQKIRYCAVRDVGTSVQILVSADNNGDPVPVSADVLTRFKQYMNRVKVAGVILDINSYDSDNLRIKADITVDPLVIDNNGCRVADGAYPVETAITQHLKSITYGGVFNKTRLVDAIQQVAGVLDVELKSVEYMVGGQWTVINGNNYQGRGGNYRPVDIRQNLTYEV